MPVDIGTIGCAERFRFPVSRARSGTGEMLTFAPMPTAINNNKDLEIENLAITLRLTPTPMPGINTAQ
jgi:hypothetical protein